MSPELLEKLFGSNPAKVYIYDGTVSDQDISASVTEMFAQAAGTNLISCVVTVIKGMIIVYTQDQVEITDGSFRLIATLPVVAVEPQTVVEPVVVGTQVEEQTNAS